MLNHAANPVAQPNSSLQAPSTAPLSWRKSNGACSMPSFWGVFAARKKATVWATLPTEIERMTSVHSGYIRLVSRPLLGVTLRACPAPCGRLALLLWLRHPAGYGFRL